MYKGRIQDTFTPVIQDKLAEFGCEMVYHAICDDDDKMVTEKINEALKQGVDIVLCTGGMSVDPDDKTPLAIKNTGANIISYGSPVLPYWLCFYFPIKEKFQLWVYYDVLCMPKEQYLI